MGRSSHMINRRGFLKAGGAAGLSTIPFSRAFADGNSENRSGEKPNLLFIFTDDQRRDDIGYANLFVHTPNQDRLSLEGVRFNQACITLPVCVPARATALTGRYTMAHGATTYTKPVNESDISFAQPLNDAGYLTAMVGKWHQSGRGRDAAGFGFQEVRRFATSLTAYWNPPVVENGLERTHAGFSTDYCVDQTIDLMKKSRSEGRPFGIWLCTQAPHPGRSSRDEDRLRSLRGGQWYGKESFDYYERNPLDTMQAPPNIDDDLSGKPPYLKTYRGRRRIEESGRLGHFSPPINVYRLITEMDRSLGRLFRALDESGLRKNTYVIFMSDNGIFRGEHGFMSKGLLYEAAVRVPLFITGPGIRPGFDDRSLVTNADIAPTMLDLAGVEIPAGMQGSSLKKTLLERKPLDRRYMLLEHPDENPTLEVRPTYALRSHQWKYIQTFEDGKDSPYTFEELYNLHEDPWELDNVAGQSENKSLIREMREELESYRREYG